MAHGRAVRIGAADYSKQEYVHWALGQQQAQWSGLAALYRNQRQILGVVEPKSRLTLSYKDYAVTFGKCVKPNPGTGRMACVMGLARCYGSTAATRCLDGGAKARSMVASTFNRQGLFLFLTFDFLPLFIITEWQLTCHSKNV